MAAAARYCGTCNRCGCRGAARRRGDPPGLAKPNAIKRCRDRRETRNAARRDYSSERPPTRTDRRASPAAPRAGLLVDCSPSRLKHRKAGCRTTKASPSTSTSRASARDEPIDRRERPGVGPDQRRHDRSQHGPAHGRRRHVRVVGLRAEQGRIGHGVLQTESGRRRGAAGRIFLYERGQLRLAAYRLLKARANPICQESQAVARRGVARDRADDASEALRRVGARAAAPQAPPRHDAAASPQRPPPPRSSSAFSTPRVTDVAADGNMAPSRTSRNENVTNEVRSARAGGARGAHI